MYSRRWLLFTSGQFTASVTEGTTVKDYRSALLDVIGAILVVSKHNSHDRLVVIFHKECKVAQLSNLRFVEINLNESPTVISSSANSNQWKQTHFILEAKAFHTCCLTVSQYPQSWQPFSSVKSIISTMNACKHMYWFPEFCDRAITFVLVQLEICRIAWSHTKISSTFGTLYIAKILLV